MRTWLLGNHKRLLLGISFMVFLFACEQEPSIKIEYIVWGTYCGECIGTCSRMYKVDANQAWVDTSSAFFAAHDRNQKYSFTGSELVVRKPEMYFKTLSNHFPHALLLEDSSILGMPDAYDQCGIYLEIQQADTSKMWKIDPHDHPEYLDGYLKILGNIGAKIDPYL